MRYMPPEHAHGHEGAALVVESDNGYQATTATEHVEGLMLENDALPRGGVGRWPEANKTSGPGALGGGHR